MNYQQWENHGFCVKKKILENGVFSAKKPLCDAALTRAI